MHQMAKLVSYADYSCALFSRVPRGSSHGRGAKKGLDQLADAVELVETTQGRWAEAGMHWPRGTLLLSMHGRAQKRPPSTHCLTQHQSAKFWELRAASAL